MAIFSAAAALNANTVEIKAIFGLTGQCISFLLQIGVRVKDEVRIKI